VVLLGGRLMGLMGRVYSVGSVDLSCSSGYQVDPVEGCRVCSTEER